MPNLDKLLWTRARSGSDSAHSYGPWRFKTSFRARGILFSIEPTIRQPGSLQNRMMSSKMRSPSNDRTSTVNVSGLSGGIDRRIPNVSAQSNSLSSPLLSNRRWSARLRNLVHEDKSRACSSTGPGRQPGGLPAMCMSTTYTRGKSDETHERGNGQ